MPRRKRYDVEQFKKELSYFTTEPFVSHRTDPVIRPTLFVDRETGLLCLSAEDGGYFADYYGEYRGGYPWVDVRLEEWAAARGLVWEWRDPGTVRLVESQV